MARKIPETRLAELAECATEVFIRRGYRQTQMADVAEALGVAKGTVYLYVESKEALFDLVARHSIAGRAFEPPSSLPIPTPEPGATVEFARASLAAGSALPRLNEAVARELVDDPAAELDGIIREIFRTLWRNRVSIKLIDRVAAENPELADVWFKGGREGLLGLLTAYLAQRIDGGVFRQPPDVVTAARAIIEMAAFWAVHRYWDPHPQAIDDSVAEDTVVAFVVRTFVRE
ncbi:MAG: TetR/AcrR family transcriptional regulator [Candidatus Binatia bacterium]